MTYKETIKILDEFGGCCSSDLEYIAAHKAIEALEKQIPKKPRKMVFGFVKESYDYSCPTCGNRIISKIDGEWCAGAKYKFCVNCGQALDWSE